MAEKPKPAEDDPFDIAGTEDRSADYFDKLREGKVAPMKPAKKD